MMSSLAYQLKQSVLDVTKQWAKQRKAEERNASAAARRRDRLSRSRIETIRDAAYAVMVGAYLHASDGGDGGRLPVTATQVMYAARPGVQERTGGKQLDRQYFNQTLLPNFIAENPVLTADWDIAYDDRGHFTEPHTRHTIGLGTWSVRDYLSQVHDLEMQKAGLAAAKIVTRGPHGAFGALFYIEKEGFLPLFEQVQLEKRFDIGILSNKGLSVTASRKLADEICHAYEIPLLVLHDFDKAGFSIKATFERRQSRRYTFQNRIKVIDLGLRLDDIAGLQSEKVYDAGSKEMRAANLRRNGATTAEIEFLLERRVELNAMTSAQLIDFIERKLTQHGVKKIIPDADVLRDAYQLFAKSKRVESIVAKAIEDVDKVDIAVPDNLNSRVVEHLKEHPELRWDEAITAIVEEEEPSDGGKQDAED
jgi:hypothetical protein